MLIKRLIRIVVSILPVIIIVGLLYVAFFVKPQTGEAVLKPYPIVRRDRIYGVTLPTPTTIWAVGSHGKILRSDDSGKSWVLQASPTLAHLQDIAAWDEKRACVVGNEGIILTTTDGGKRWKKVKTPLDDQEAKTGSGEKGLDVQVSSGMSEEMAKETASQTPKKLIAVKTFPDGSAWAVGEMGAVLCSKDEGRTWERRMKAEDVGWNDCSFIEQNGLIVGEFGRIMRTDDGGQTWTAVKSPVESSLMGVAFRDKEHGVAVGLQGVVLVTEDGGKRWTQAPAATSEHLFSVIWDGGQWVAVGDKGVMFKGDPAGLNWSGGRITDLDTSWYTKVRKIDDRYYCSGDRLAVLKEGVIEFFDRKI